MQNLYLTSVAAKTLDKIVTFLDKSPKDLKVAFVPTAADPYENRPWLDEDRDKLISLGFEVAELDLKGKNESDLRKDLSDTDIIFVAGGNTFYLLEKVKKSGFDKVVKDLVNKGVIYIGSSAGSVLVGPDIEPVKVFDDPNEAQLESTKGLGWVDFVVLPHYKKEKYGVYHQQVIEEYKDKYKLIPITDEQFIKVEGEEYKIY